MKKADKKWKYIVGKIRGDKSAYGETDTSKKKIIINKKFHKSKWNHAKGVRLNKNGTANITDSEVHELLHKAHPKAWEKTIRKKTRKRMKTLGRKEKQRINNKFK